VSQQEQVLLSLYSGRDNFTFASFGFDWGIEQGLSDGITF
jgi:hypothetical protein